MRVENGSLVIREAVLSDAEQLTKWWNDGAVMAHAGFPHGLGQSVERTRSQISQNSRGLAKRCIIEKDTVRVGEMNYTFGNDGGETYAEIGIKICEGEYQNHGDGSKLLKMLIGFLFTDVEINAAHKIDKIILDTNLKNERAQHVYEKIGFRRLRVRENSWRDQLGQMQSSVDYDLPRKLWETLE